LALKPTRLQMVEANRYDGASPIVTKINYLSFVLTFRVNTHMAKIIYFVVSSPSGRANESTTVVFLFNEFGRDRALPQRLAH